jgi:hypothetical protein
LGRPARYARTEEEGRELQNRQERSRRRASIGPGCVTPRRYRPHPDPQTLGEVEKKEEEDRKIEKKERKKISVKLREEKQKFEEQSRRPIVFRFGCRVPVRAS